MDPQALSALISATAGLLGALLGFAGSQLTHKRDVDLARDQRRFERAQEMRAEVIPKLFVELKNLEEIFDHILDFPISLIEVSKEVVREENEGLLNAGQRGPRFRELFAPWLKRNLEVSEKY